MVLSILAAPTSHRMMVRSSDAEARNLLSAEKAASLTPCRWPWSTCRHFHDDVLQSRIVMSAEVDANHFPSGEIFTEETARLWPCSVCVHAYLDLAAVLPPPGGAGAAINFKYGLGAGTISLGGGGHDSFSVALLFCCFPLHLCPANEPQCLLTYQMSLDLLSDVSAFLCLMSWPADQDLLSDVSYEDGEDSRRSAHTHTAQPTPSCRRRRP